MEQSQGRCRTVTQLGLVAHVYDSAVDIDLVRGAACGGCAAKSVCVADHTAERRTVRARVVGRVRVGEQVLVHMEERVGWLTVALTFIVPLCVAVATLFALLPQVSRQEFAGLAALAALVPYYLILRMAQPALERAVQFWATPLPMCAEDGLR